MSTQRLRVLHLIDQLNPGGAEHFTIEVVARLDGGRYDRTLCATRTTADWWPADERARAIAGLEAAGVKFLQLKRTSRTGLHHWLPLVRHLRREKIQVLHAHMFGSSVWGTIIGRLAGVPVIIAHEHGSPVKLDRNRATLERWLLGRGVDAYIAVSEMDRKLLVDRGVPASRTRVLQNGIPAPTVDESRDVRAELGLPTDAPVVMSVGQLRPEKGHDVLLRAFAEARELRGGEDLRLVIVGDGVEEERQVLRSLRAELGLEEWVTFAGLRSDVPELLRGADIAVNTSYREGSPLSVMEYLEAALPVVATRVGGVPDIIDDGITGVLVPPNDATAVATAITGLLADRERATEMGRRGREVRRERFDLDAVAQRLGELYDELWRSRRRG